MEQETTKGNQGGSRAHGGSVMDEMLISKIYSPSFTQSTGKMPVRGSNQFPDDNSYYDRLTTVHS